jgi:c-di-GMP-binding flagellar brake protein YcgR
LRVGEPLRIHFFLEGHYYRFDTVVVERVQNPLPLLAVLKPAEIHEVQRRRWVRIPISLPVKFQLEHSTEAEIYEGQTIDISGGGIQYRSETALEPGTIIHLCLDLPRREPICCKARVLRFEEDSELKGQEARIVVEFVDISEGQRDRIMNFIFEKQREWIRKGLL